ncbi:HYR domain-containing protein [Tangfeifania diversioriginum]|uniref:HYR domain-containing protein n=1 Tax=Tangfeifania diversioriginum TaxID=1168035 RepID=A0A1M6HGQ0_9BACT|nr:HYR domain-containing protein [Tangfeifania diversioriginum]SHJ21314.1 HYR domain-containing protein [Tangfeifania diversioriginum]
MVKNRGHITLVRILILVTFLLTAVLDEKSDAREVSLYHFSGSRTRFTTSSLTECNCALLNLNTGPTADKTCFFKTGFPILNQNEAGFSIPNVNSTKLFLVPLLASGALKKQGYHPINGPPDRAIQTEDLFNQPFKSKAVIPSPAGSCIPIPENLLASLNPLQLTPGSEVMHTTNKKSTTYDKKTPSTSFRAQQNPEITCPGDISTYTDINTCESFISGNLDPEFDENEVASLTWEMTGATEDASPPQGINRIGSHTFNEGATMVTYTATGNDRNTTSCSFTVTISDNQVPRLENIPGDITVQAAPGECSATVFWIEPTASDNCTPNRLIIKENNYEPGDEFPVGTTRVEYIASDAMGNESQQATFTITVEDTEPPVLSMPADTTIQCGDEIPASWQTLQQLTAAGGSATDNCKVDETTFRLLSETQSRENCPYALTKVYEIADASGNVATAEHRIVVEGEEEVAETDEEVELKGAMAGTTTAIDDGDWDDPATWDNGVPDGSTNVVIPSAYTVTLTDDAVCNDINIEGTLNYLDNGAYNLQVYGNWTNSGSYNGGTNGIVEFAGSVDATISGNTTFEDLIISKGSLSTTLSIIGTAAISGGGSLKMNSGLVQVGSGNSFNINSTGGFTIEETAGLEINGGTLTTGAFSIENKGLFKINDGTVTLGQTSGNSLTIRSSGTLEVNDGTVNIAGRLVVSGGTADIFGGTINLNTEGHSSSSLATLDLTATSDFNMTGGTINFLNPNGSGNLDLSILDGGTKNFGGTLNFGTGTYKISSDTSFPNFTSTGDADIIYRIPVTENGTYNFPLTTAAGASIPASITISGSDYTNAYIEIETFDEKHPENANTTNFLNRYWTIATSGITNLDYDVTVDYHSNDISGTISGFIVGDYTGSVWNETGNATISGNTISITEITQQNFEFTALSEPTVSVSASPETICYGTSTTLTATATGDQIESYSWNPATDLDLTDPANPIASPSVTTTYEVTVTDGNGFIASDDIEVIVHPLPTAQITSADLTICDGGSVNISGNVTANGNWTLTLSDGSTATGTGDGTFSVIVNPNTTTTYSISSLSDENCDAVESGLTGTTTVTVVEQPVAPDLTKNPNLSDVCEGQTLTVSVTAGTGGAGNIDDEYRYSTDNGTNWSAWSTTVPTFNAVEGINLIESRRTADGTGCTESTPNRVSWIVIAQPEGPTLASKTPGDDGVCVGQSVSATFNSGSGGVGCSDEFQYSFDGINWATYSGGNINTTGHEGNTLIIQGRRTNCAVNTECTGTNWATIAEWEIYPLPIPTITGNFLPCQTTTVTYTTESGMSSYDWSVSAGGSVISGGDGTNQIDVRWNNSGSQAIEVNYTTPEGCTASNSTVETVNVYQKPTLVINDPEGVCAPGTVDLTAPAITTGSTSGLTYDYFTDATGNTALTAPETVTTSGTYYIRGESSDGCFTDIKPVEVTIYDEVEVVITDPDPVCTPATVNLTNAAITSGSTTGLNYTYWLDANATNSLTNYTTVATTGTYYIKGETTNGCYDIQPVNVTVNTTPEMTTDNTKTICSGESTDILLQANVDANFSWTIGEITGNISGAEAGSGSLIDQELEATEATGGTVEYLVTAKADYDNDFSCESSVFPITVTVNTLPTVTQQPETPLLVCGKSNTAISSYSTASPSATIQWEYSMDGTTGWTPVPDGLVGSGDLRDFEFDGTTKNLLELFAPDSDEEVFFRAAFTNSCGTTHSDISHVVVDKHGPFVNTDIDQEEVACVGGEVTLTAKITGSGAGNNPDNINEAWLQYNNNGVWEEVPGSYQKSNNSGQITYSYTINTGDYPYEPEFRIYVTGKCGTSSTSVKILYLQSVVTTVNSCIGGDNVQFLLDDEITNDNNLDQDEGWTVNGGGDINPVTGEFEPTTPGCYEATYAKGNCIDTKPFVVFPEVPAFELTGGCGTELEIPEITPVADFSLEFAVQPPGGTLSEYGTRTQANTILNNTSGCWTILARYVLTSDCSTEYATVPAGTISPCGDYTVNALVLPEPPVLNTPNNTCNTTFTLPSVPAISGFSVEWKIDGNDWAATPTLPTDPGCHTIQARYVLENECGTLPASATGDEDCVSNIVSVVIYPPAPPAPEVSAGCGPFEVTPPADIGGFNIEYSFDDGDTWGSSNQSPAGDDCSGYEVKTRYVLADDCGNTNAGDASSSLACSESDATLRIIDTTPPDVTCNTPAPDPVCVNTAAQTYVHTGTSWDATVIENCETTSVFASLSGDTEAVNLTTLNNVEFNIGITTVTWEAFDGCNYNTCEFTVTVNPKPVINPYSVEICSDGSFSYTPENETDGIVPTGTTYSWSAPSVAGIEGTVAGTDETNISGTLTNTTDQPIDVVYTVTPTAGICDGEPFTVTITVNPVITCTISGPAEPLCPNTEYIFTAETGMSNYFWSITGDATIVGNTDGETVTIRTADVCDGAFTLNLNYNDASGCGSTCELTVTILDETAPVITTQPVNDEALCVSGGAGSNTNYQTWLENNGGATATDNCSDVTWTNNSTTQDWVIDLVAHAKTKTVTFTATDECGNSTDTDPAIFTITDDEPPTITCPGDGNPIVLQAITGECEVTEYEADLDPVYSDICSDPELSYILNLPDGTTVEGDGSVDGYNFPLGETTVTYIATDDVGNEASCQFTVFVEWTEFYETIVDCPPVPDPVFVENGETEAWVEVSAPTYDDPCVAVKTVEHDSEFSTETENANGNYPIGTTIVTWTITDVSGNTYECEQEVVVLAAPVIECPDPDTLDAGSGVCSALFDPLEAELVSGGRPLVWTYTISWPDGRPDTYVEFDETTEGVEGPPEIGEMEFPVGTTTIYWTATNPSGTDECSHTITVIDNEPPSFTPPAAYENCVDPLHWATYDPDNANPVVNHIDPNLNKYPVDFRTFESENTELNIENINDNCCADDDLIIHWKIEFSPTPDPQNEDEWITHDPIESTGQPSEYGSDIELWGDGVEFNTITHTITYWLEDCSLDEEGNGNMSEPISVDIVITPRPQITKENY